VADSVLLRLRADAGGHPVRRLDLFVYSQDGTQPLLGYARYDGQLPDTLALKVPEGTHRAVGIANSPHNFNLNALGRFDAMEKLTYGFSDDDPAWPVLGGTCGSVRDTGTVRMTPLLCRIVLASVANTMDGYELLESPRIRIRDIPDTAEILREEGFRPSELIDAGPWAELPCDIGYFPQEPGTVLWCYPNDTPENVLGTPRPCLEFACRIRGEDCSFELPLPPLSRGCTVEVELVIDGPDEYLYKMRQN